MKLLLFLSEITIPLLIFCIVGYGLLNRQPVYEEFVEGAKDGFWTVIKIMPTLIGLMVAVGVLRASGLLDCIAQGLGQITAEIGFPAELFPVTIVKMFSSSAATGLGVGKLQIEKPSDITTKQAAAAVGQCELMYTYDRLFGQYNHTVAQMLLTWEDFDHEQRRRNLQNTLERLLQLRAIPIINENDPVACEEYSLGDNDTLAALVATCIHADLVVLMSDIDGLYTADPHTCLLYTSPSPRD